MSKNKLLKMTELEKKFSERYFTITRIVDGGWDVNVNWDYIYSIPEFAKLKETRQSPKWHSESEFVSGHVERVVDVCCKRLLHYRGMDEDEAVILVFASLFHDIGKIETTFFKESDQMWHHYNHEVASEKITRRLLWDLGHELREVICGIVRWHMFPMQIAKMKDVELKLLDLQNKVQSMKLLCLLKVFDREGSVAEIPNKNDKYIIDYFCILCKSLGVFEHNNEIAYTKKSFQHLITDKKSINVYMYFGLPGSGKDTAIKKYYNDGDVIVSRDDIRIELGFCKEGEKYLGTPTEEQQVTDVFNMKLKKAAEDGKIIVINNTNLKKKYRDGYKELLKKYDVVWTYIYCEADSLTTNIERRKGQIREDVFVGMIDGFEWPARDEYDHLIYQKS